MIFLIIFLLVNVFEPARFFGSDLVWELVSLGSLLGGCIYYLPLRNGKLFYTPIFNTRGVLVFVAFILLLIISFWRTHSFLDSQFSVFKKSLIITLLPVFIYLLYQKKTEEGEGFEQVFLKTIIHVLGIFCFANFLAFVISPTYGAGAATTFQFIGITTKKLIYTLYPHTHPARIGSLGGFLVVLSAAYLRHVKAKDFKEKAIMILYIGIGFFIILISDSRANLFTAILCIVGMYALIRFNKLNVLKYAVWVVPFSSFIFIAILQISANTSFMSNISRGNSSDIATGNSRAFIYKAANKELGDFKPIHVVGFGEYGPYGAGITKYYMEAKFGYKSKEQKLISSVTHNTALQVIFDIGYIGLLVYMFLLFSIFSQSISMFKNGKTALILVCYILGYMVINGTSGTYYGHYNAFQNYLFVILAFFVILVLNKHLINSKLEEASNKVVTKETIPTTTLALD